MTEVTVLYDRISYVGAVPGNPRQRMTADKGQVVEMSDAEYQRLRRLDPPAVGTQEDLILLTVTAGATPVTIPTNSASLRLMTVDALATYMAAAGDKEQKQVSDWMDEILLEKQGDAALRVQEATAAAEARAGAANANAGTPETTTAPITSAGAIPTAESIVAAMKSLTPEERDAFLARLEEESDALLADPDAPPAKPEPGAAATDDELDSMNQEDLLAYMSQHPDELDRIESLETSWGKGKDGGMRVGIESAITKTREALADAGT